MMGSIERGAKQAVEKCLKVKPGENVLIIMDSATREVAHAIWQAAEKITGNIQFFVMEDYGERPLKGFPPEMGEALQKADVSLYVAQGLEGEGQTIRGPMLDIVEANRHLRHAHMVGVTEQIMREGMCADYREIQALSNKLHERLRFTKEIAVSAEGGTVLIARFSPEIKWVVCDGNIRAGEWDNLPDGEVFTCPIDVDGFLVVDGCLGDYFDLKFGLLDKTPVSVEIKNGRAVKGSILCANQALAQEFAAYLFQGDENSDRVGEFALGTNLEVKRLIGNLLQDEKMPGVHIAFGDSYPLETGAKWGSEYHVDAVIRKPTVFLDGEMIMRGGKYVF